MVKKNGFISISIIYSFFIVFLLLLLLMITTYVNNRFNFNIFKEDIKMQMISASGTAGTFQNFRDYIISLEETTASQTAWKVVYEGDGYRYQGGTPRNYVRFNNEMWRIIGVFDSTSHGKSGNLVKLIRDVPLATKFDNGTSNSWVNCSLKTTLNNSYIWNQTSSNMIQSVNWKIGNTTNPSQSAANLYSLERNGSNVDANVGLMVPSDYGYAVLADFCPRETTLNAYNPATEVSNCVALNWLSSPFVQYTITAATSQRVMVINAEGNLTTGVINNSTYTAKPVVYLKSNVLLSGGDGSYDNPFTITVGGS